MNKHNRWVTVGNFPLIHNKRRRIHNALDRLSKLSKTVDLFCVEIDNYRWWFEYQFAPDMILEKYRY